MEVAQMNGNWYFKNKLKISNIIMEDKILKKSLENISNIKSFINKKSLENLEFLYKKK